DPTPEELCPGEATLQAQLRERITKRKQFHALLNLRPASDASSRPATLAVPGFSMLDEIGQGGMGVVYRARQHQPHRMVALKVVRPERASALAMQRFEHEADVLGRMQHPGVAQIHEAGTLQTSTGRRPYFVMEFVAGHSLIRYAEEQRLDIRKR